jgi:hypothetical protein
MIFSEFIVESLFGKYYYERLNHGIYVEGDTFETKFIKFWNECLLRCKMQTEGLTLNWDMKSESIVVLWNK